MRSRSHIVLNEETDEQDSESLPSSDGDTESDSEAKTLDEIIEAYT